MCLYTDFLFVISIKYEFKYLLSTYYSLKINCGLGVHWHLPRFYTIDIGIIVLSMTISYLGLYCTRTIVSLLLPHSLHVSLTCLQASDHSSQNFSNSFPIPVPSSRHILYYNGSFNLCQHLKKYIEKDADTYIM
jgi:hypothetical protein